MFLHYYATLQSRTGPVQGQNRDFPVYFFHTGKNLFSLQGSKVMKTDFSLYGNTIQGKPCFHYRDGFAVKFSKKPNT